MIMASPGRIGDALAVQPLARETGPVPLAGSGSNPGMTALRAGSAQKAGGEAGGG